jgi:porphobilinogen deaminase
LIRVATRRSPLALLQAEEVAARLRALGAEVKVVRYRRNVPTVAGCYFTSE